MRKTTAKQNLRIYQSQGNKNQISLEEQVLQMMQGKVHKTVQSHQKNKFLRKPLKRLLLLLMKVIRIVLINQHTQVYPVNIVGKSERNYMYLKET